MSTPLPQPGAGVIAIGGLAQASRHKRRFDAILTVEDPGSRNGLRVSDRPQLVLAFEDCDQAELGYAVATKDQIATALAFMNSAREGSLLVHCQHGVGRSAAIALAGIASILGEGRETEAVQRLLELRPEATPNLIALGHADELLGRRGSLVAALLSSEAANPAKLTMRSQRARFARENPGLYAKAS